jgi:hypothetical protein
MTAYHMTACFFIQKKQLPRTDCLKEDYLKVGSRKYCCQDQRTLIMKKENQNYIDDVLHNCLDVIIKATELPFEYRCNIEIEPLPQLWKKEKEL